MTNTVSATKPEHTMEKANVTLAQMNDAVNYLSKRLNDIEDGLPWILDADKYKEMIKARDALRKDVMRLTYMQHEMIVESLK
jgi:hypothetical protein